MKNILIGFTCIAMITFWYSCTKDTAPAPGGNTGNCDTSKVNFTQNLLPIIEVKCGLGAGTDCHSSGTSNSDLTSYVVAKSEVDNILCRIQAPGTTFCGARMPQGMLPLADSVKAVFVKWKTDGLYDCR